MNRLPLTLMSWNIYLGADVSGIINAKPQDVPSRMTALWNMAQQTDFRLRAEAIAEQIVTVQPDVIGLQEVYRWSQVQRRSLSHPSSETVIYDFLPLLLDELHKRGQQYFSTGRSFGINVLLPTTKGYDVRMEDSVAMLVRAGSDHDLEWENPRQGRFHQALRVKIDGEFFDISRGWISIDLRRGDGVVRVINTHIEYFDAQVQPAQVDELLEGPASVAGPLVLMGDFNCKPDSPAWQTLLDAGYQDAWVVAGNGLGFTSAQDEDLCNPEPTFYERIDWIMCRGDIQIQQAALAGNTAFSKTRQELWPSDHAAVIAQISVGLDNSRPQRPVRTVSFIEPLGVVREMFTRFEQKDLAGVMEFVNPNSSWFFPGNPKILPWAGWYRGAGLMRFFILCANNLEYISYKSHTFYVDGEYVTVLGHERCRVKVTERIFDNDLVQVVRVVNGKVVKFLEFSDTAAMQAGFLPRASAS